MRRIFIEADKCEGCKNCSVACMQAHSESPSGRAYGLDLKSQINFCKDHGDDPSCVKMCLKKAIHVMEV